MAEARQLFWMPTHVNLINEASLKGELEKKLTLQRIPQPSAIDVWMLKCKTVALLVGRGRTGYM